MKDASFSFGAIFIGDNVDDTNLLLHEYGHVLQLREIGVIGYIEHVVVPSVTCFWATKAGILSNDLYFSLPWENKADTYGGAKGEYIPGASDLADLYWSAAKFETLISPLG